MTGGYKAGILFVIQGGLRWCDAPAAYGPNKTINNRFICWSRLGVFNKTFASLAADGSADDILMMIDATHLKAHRAVAGLLKRVCSPKNRKPAGRLKLHAVCDGISRPLILCLSEGQMSDHIGVKLTYPALPDQATYMIGDKGYQSDEYRAALKAKGITPCIPP